MKTISENKYKEYLALKRWAKREKVYQSMTSTTKLEDDIDLPVKKCVAMFALLGFQPIFSCCGFDYHGQLYHKSHQYGEPYFMFSENEKSKSLIGVKYGAWIGEKRHAILLIAKVKGNPHWRKKDCIHFSEECVISIGALERWLLSNTSIMVDTITLQDTNQNYKKSGIRHWQYEPKEPWIIRKDLLDTY